MKHCESCRTKNACDVIFTYNKGRSKYRSKCPCLKCVVLVMCNQSCDSYQEFWDGKGIMIFGMSNPCSERQENKKYGRS